MPLTPADVRNKQFSTTRLRPGYDEEEVDAFLDEVESELDRLIQENEELRSKLSECMRSKQGGSSVPAPAGPPPEAKPEPKPEPPPPPPEPQQAPAAVPGPAFAAAVASGEDNMDTAARVLALAQQTADQAIADARREADETLGRARREADETLGKARRQAEQIAAEARARAEALESDAQDRHRQAMGTLVQQRDELERKVDDLRAFEREYRSRLKAYLEGQLRELEAGASDSGPIPARSTGRSAALPSADAQNGQPGGGPTGPFAAPAPQGSVTYGRGAEGPGHDRR